MPKDRKIARARARAPINLDDLSNATHRLIHVRRTAQLQAEIFIALKA